MSEILINSFVKEIKNDSDEENDFDDQSDNYSEEENIYSMECPFCSHDLPSKYALEIHQNTEMCKNIKREFFNNKYFSDLTLNFQHSNKILKSTMNKLEEQEQEIICLKKTIENINKKYDYNMECMAEYITSLIKYIQKNIIKHINPIEKLKDLKILNSILKNKFDLQKEKENNEVKKKRKIPKRIKTKVWNKYIPNGKESRIGKCYCCRITEIYSDDHHCGHVVSEKDGGKEIIENLRPICSSCNSSMGTQNMIDFIINYELWKE
jgi:5-methylcytosine-specific restriction endonuclease McrA